MWFAISLAIISMWASAAYIALVRSGSNVFLMFSLAFATTVILGILGYRLGKGGL